MLIRSEETNSMTYIHKIVFYITIKRNYFNSDICYIYIYTYINIDFKNLGKNNSQINIYIFFMYSFFKKAQIKIILLINSYKK